MKNSFREFFASVSPMLKMNYFLKKAGVSQSAFSRYMKGKDWNYEISEVKLNDLRFVIIEELQKIA